MKHTPTNLGFDLHGLSIPNHRRRLLRVAMGLSSGRISEIPLELTTLKPDAPRRVFAERLLSHGTAQLPQLVARRLYLVSAYPTESEAIAILVLTVPTYDDGTTYISRYLSALQHHGLDQLTCFVLWGLVARAWEVQGALVPGALFGRERALMGGPQNNLVVDLGEDAE